MKLKYLFEAQYTDGTVFKQKPEDVSEIDPKRSAFYDVLHSGKQVKSFSLKRFLDKWSVDLETGVFTHNGIEFQLEENPSIKKTLEFFRQHQHDMNRNGQETDHRVVYFLGYKVGRKKVLVGIK